MSKSTTKGSAKQRAMRLKYGMQPNHDTFSESLDPELWMFLSKHGSRPYRRESNRKLRSWAKTSDGKKAFQGEYKSMAGYLK